jgi:hypothetical protein
MKIDHVLCLLLGACGGYFAARKALNKEYNLRLEAELQRTREFYDARYAVNEEKAINSTIANLFDEEPEISTTAARLIEDNAVRAVTSYQTGTITTVKGIVESEDPDVATALQEEVKTELAESVPLPIDRNNPYIAKPYIITAEAFLENEADYEQITLTYYEGDSVLTDQTDEVMDTEWTVRHTGFENLTKFGQLSGDENVVYICCEEEKKLFEVARSTGKYAVEVVGLSNS